MTDQSTTLLAGDIGGTKTNLALYNAEIGLTTPLVEATFASGNFPSLEAVVQTFLANVDDTYEINRASFGVAGPVIDGQASVTNLPWEMEENALAFSLNIPRVHLLNDLLSIANAVPVLKADDLATLNQGNPVSQGPIGIVAPGTGLGEAFLVWNGTRYQAYPSEGGHSSFAPTTPLQVEMTGYLLDKFGHVSYERVCSGIGLPNIYQFLKECAIASEPDWLAQQLAETPDPVPVIVNNALDEENACEICALTLENFVTILAAEAGNLGLKLLARGGIYLGGGIPPRILSVLKQDRFMTAFRHKGRFGDLLAEMPVKVILNPKSALLGAASYGLSH
ncbi:MAG: glucokinase [Chloroflexota bacterium]